MPNYCHNRLRVRGTTGELQQLVAAVADAESADANDRFAYHEFIPNVGEEEWYEIWGSSAVYCLKVTENPGEVIYEFESPWDPPLDVIEHLAGLWPALAFEFIYVEPLTFRYGARSYCDGERSAWTDAGLSGWAGGGLLDNTDRWMRAFLEYAWPELAAEWWPVGAEAAA